MSEQRLFKCRILYGYDREAGGLANAYAYATVRLAAEAWLNENNREDHLVNVYDNQERGLLFVLSDRDTALMLKLALA
ncbi:hypothetical protein [Sphingomonas paucimobilis]|uniref:hypothetical protein n=1 Tax=Sphingomonas paucimobilis TaxID=13689 RepID=UPI0031E47ECE